MSVPNRPSLLASLLDPALLIGKQEAECAPAAVSPAPAEPPPASAEARPGPDFRAIVRANLRAAARHVMRNHPGPSFRECSRPACRNASNLIPYPAVVKPDVTDADLEAIFQRVVTTALEEIAANPGSIEVAFEGWEDPELVC